MRVRFANRLQDEFVQSLLIALSTMQQVTSKEDEAAADVEVIDDSRCRKIVDRSTSRRAKRS